MFDGSSGMAFSFERTEGWKRNSASDFTAVVAHDTRKCNGPSAPLRRQDGIFKKSFRNGRIPLISFSLPASSLCGQTFCWFSFFAKCLLRPQESS